jgi:hypothetical protein
LSDKIGGFCGRVCPPTIRQLNYLRAHCFSI